MSKHSFNRTILREYDIRGVYNHTLFDKDAYFIGRCFGSILRKANKESISVGYDGRMSSPALEAQLVKGLTDCGLTVYRVGLCPTPLVYFSEYCLSVDASVMITGSHNPIDHNGFKITFNKSAFFGSSISDFYELAKRGDFIDGEGKIIDIDIKAEYTEFLVNDFNKSYPQPKHLKVIWDAGNGTAAVILKNLLKRLPGQHIVLNDEVNGCFPGRGPDPTDPKNLRELRSMILQKQYDLGIAFDGDGDRLVIIDNKGEILWGDIILLFLAQEVLEDCPGETIIADVKSSSVLFDQIKKLNGVPLMWKTGHSHVKKKMKEISSPLAGEVSGHIFFSHRYYGYDDAIYAAIRFIGLLSQKDYKLNEWHMSLPNTICTREYKIECCDNRKFAIIEEVKKRLKSDSQEFIDIDGVRVLNRNGWWLLRPSNTQPALIFRAEANNRNNLNLLVKNISEYLRFCNIDHSEILELCNF